MAHYVLISNLKPFKLMPIISNNVKKFQFANKFLAELGCFQNIGSEK